MTGRAGVHEAAAVGFERGADEYERARPGYPDEVFDLLAERHGLITDADVVDLAAGTGKLTVGLVDRGARVTAIEPLTAMRDRLTALLPTVTAVDGLAESLPLPGDAADLVTVAQAFHWFDAPEALAEVRRVLRPGGHLGMIWNVRDETVDWVRAVGDLGEAAGGGRPYDKHTSVDWERLVVDAGGFGPVREDWFPNWQEVDIDIVVDRVASTSWVSALPDPERAAVLSEVRDLLERHPATRRRERFPFPHATVVLTTTSEAG
jgi:SAM-dependent methyltransferase